MMPPSPPQLPTHPPDRRFLPPFPVNVCTAANHETRHGARSAVPASGATHEPFRPPPRPGTRKILTLPHYLPVTDTAHPLVSVPPHQRSEV
eukprot:11497792-Prorocentrum_lima.AAC.1